MKSRWYAIAIVGNSHYEFHPHSMHQRQRGSYYTPTIVMSGLHLLCTSMIVMLLLDFLTRLQRLSFTLQTPLLRIPPTDTLNQVTLNQESSVLGVYFFPLIKKGFGCYSLLSKLYSYLNRLRPQCHFQFFQLFWVLLIPTFFLKRLKLRLWYLFGTPFNILCGKKIKNSEGQG